MQERGEGSLYTIKNITNNPVGQLLYRHRYQKNLRYHLYTIEGKRGHGIIDTIV